jgi:hypothetical protein
MTQFWLCYMDCARGKIVLARLESQAGGHPFNPRLATTKFAHILKEYGLRTVTGDAYAGQVFPTDFAERGITYRQSALTKSELYEALEPKLNANEVELLDIGKLQEQLLTLVWRGVKVDHQPGDHDDYANAAAMAIYHTKAAPMKIPEEYLAKLRMRSEIRRAAFVSAAAGFPGARRRPVVNAGFQGDLYQTLAARAEK